MDFWHKTVVVTPDDRKCKATTPSIKQLCVFSMESACQPPSYVCGAGFEISLVRSSETSNNDSRTSGIPAGLVRQTTAYLWFSHKLHWLYIFQTSEWHIRSSDFYNPLARQTSAFNLKFGSLWWLRCCWKLSWFIRHLSDGLYVFYSNLWNLSSDIWAWPLEISNVSDDFREHCDWWFHINYFDTDKSLLPL